MDQQVTEHLAQLATTSRAGKDILIGKIAEITNNVEKLVVERIDSLITRLQNLKEVAVLENKASLEKFAGFIEMIDDGLKETEKLEGLVERLERK